MHADLLAPYDALARRTRNLLSQLAALSEEQRRYQPAPDAWCLLQVAEHLAIIEETVTRGLERGLPAGRRRGLRDRLAHPLMLTVLRLPVRVKAPMPVLVPQGVHSLEQVRQRWSTVRAALAAFLADVAADALDEPVIVHPFAGPLGIRQTVSFLGSHFDHHLFQVDRIRDHRGFPDGGDEGGEAGV